MDCNAIRNMLDEESRDPSVREHLAACPSCRAEAEFGRRVAAAVASLPRVPAPGGLAGSVMAELRPVAPVLRPAAARPSLILRSWELGWIGIASLLLIALIRFAFGSVARPLAAQLSPWLSGWSAPQTYASSAFSAARAWLPNGPASAEWNRLLAVSLTGAPIAWASGAAAFALGMFLLLSWHGAASGRDRWEDAHA